MAQKAWLHAGGLGLRLKRCSESQAGKKQRKAVGFKTEVQCLRMTLFLLWCEIGFNQPCLNFEGWWHDGQSICAICVFLFLFQVQILCICVFWDWSGSEGSCLGMVLSCVFQSYNLASYEAYSIKTILKTFKNIILVFLDLAEMQKSQTTWDLGHLGRAVFARCGPIVQQANEPEVEWKLTYTGAWKPRYHGLAMLRPCVPF